MKNKWLLALCLGCLLLSSCSSGVKQEEYDAIKSSFEAMESKKALLKQMRKP